jgi:serine/threonine protein phosphatase PrpC
MPSWSVTVFTHRGRGRAANEDAVGAGNRVFTGDMVTPKTIVLPDEPSFVLLADGIGGNVHGATASSEVLRSLSSTPASSFFKPESCLLAIRRANAHLYRLMANQPDTRGMGATLIGAAISDDAIAVFNVGDSPGFIYRPGLLLELSVRDIPPVKIGASKPKWAHQITQSLGGTLSEMLISPHHSSLRPDWTKDAVLLCSDGITDTVSEDTIIDILQRSQDQITLVRDLHHEALATGGRDDVSIAFVSRS